MRFFVDCILNDTKIFVNFVFLACNQSGRNRLFMTLCCRILQVLVSPVRIACEKRRIFISSAIHRT